MMTGHINPLRSHERHYSVVFTIVAAQYSTVVIYLMKSIAVAHLLISSDLSIGLVSSRVTLHYLRSDLTLSFDHELENAS